MELLQGLALLSVVTILVSVLVLPQIIIFMRSLATTSDSVVVNPAPEKALRAWKRARSRDMPVCT